MKHDPEMLKCVELFANSIIQENKATGRKISKLVLSCRLNENEVLRARNKKLRDEIEILKKED